LIIRIKGQYIKDLLWRHPPDCLLNSTLLATEKEGLFPWIEKRKRRGKYVVNMRLTSSLLVFSLLS
jgi:hypothetical protein